MDQHIVIIQGSKSDTPYTDKIVSELQSYGLPVTRRIASAHRTPEHLQKILNQYDNSSDKTVFITVAGLSDALSGTVAARFSGRVIACPPDLLKYGERKIFSSTYTPNGIEVKLAREPKEAAAMARSILESYDPSEVEEFRRQAIEKQLQTIMDDARLQGVENPLPYTFLRKGKVREIYDDGRELIINSSNRISAFDENSVTEIPDKGLSLNQLSKFWFEQTNSIVPNHFIDIYNDTAMRVKKAKRIDIEWVIRGYLYGSFNRDYQNTPSIDGKKNVNGIELPDGLQLAEKLPEIKLTPTTKSEVGHDRPITKQEAINLGLITGEEWDICEENAFKLYNFYTRVAEERGVIIPDFKLEFGRYDEQIIQIDEAPTHDSARFWIAKYHVVGKRQENWCLDKEFYRQFLIDSGIDPKNPPRPLPEIHSLVVEEIRKRTMGAYQVFTGMKNLDELNLRSLEEVEKELGIKNR